MLVSLSVCLSGCRSVWAITFECLDLETSFYVCTSRYMIIISRSCLTVKVKGSSLRLQGGFYYAYIMSSWEGFFLFSLVLTIYYDTYEGMIIKLTRGAPIACNNAIYTRATRKLNGCVPRYFTKSTYIGLLYLCL